MQLETILQWKSNPVDLAGTIHGSLFLGSESEMMIGDDPSMETIAC